MAAAGPLACRRQHVLRLLAIKLDAVVEHIVRLAGFGDDQLDEQDPARCRHEGGGQQVLHVHPHHGVASQHGTGDRGHAAAHDGEKLRIAHLGHVGFDHQRRLALTDEDVGHRRHGFGLGGAEQPRHGAADEADHQLHDAEVVEHGDERREEDHQGQHVEGKHEADAIHREVDQVAKQEVDTRLAACQHGVDPVGHPLQRPAPQRYIEHQSADGDLQGQRQPHGAQANGPAVGRCEHGDEEQRRHTEKSCCKHI